MDIVVQLNRALADRYLVEAEIGRGGMATVYRARDVRHKRAVALKVLNPELGAVLGVERFIAEIQVTANLQHPNLLPLFDSGEADGLLFYVMPLIEGESLRARIERERQLPVDEAVHIAKGIASALDYAHRHGVIHRDLKPENVLLHDGQALVADFGIALAVSNAGGNRITQTGLSLGTPHYMSPEQATGDRAVDSRSDIYALGAVTYEMLVGEPPHDGKTSQAIIAKVLTDRPRGIRLARDTVPEVVEGAVMRALAKLPADRFPTARAFADALDLTAAGRSASVLLVAEGAPQPPRATAGRWSVAAWLMGVATVGGLAFIAGRRTAAAEDAFLARYEVRVPRGVGIPASGGGALAIAPNGRTIAFIGSGADNARRLYLRGAGDLVPREVVGSQLARFPFFSPDGQWIGFWAAGQLMRAPVSGGPATAIATMPAVSRSTWAAGGTIVTTVGRNLVAVAERGGSPKVIAWADSARGFAGLMNPVAVDDGRTILFTALGMGGSVGSRIGVVRVDGAGFAMLDVVGAVPLGMVDDAMVFLTADGSVQAVALDRTRRHVAGRPVPLGERVDIESGSPNAYAVLGADGSLLFRGRSERRQLVAVSPDGTTRPVLVEPGDFQTPRVSPDGRQLAMTVNSPGRRDVWILRLPSGPFTRLTTEGAVNDRPEWMPDGRRVLFRSDREGLAAIWVQPADGSMPAVRLLGDSSSRVDEGVVTADGRTAVYQLDRAGLGEAWARTLIGSDPARRLGEGAFGETGMRPSPDGRWVAFGANYRGATEVYVRPLAVDGERVQVSLRGGSTPVWSPDGRKLYYVADRRLVEATITSTAPFTVGSRRVVLEPEYTFSNIHADFDVSRDGKSILAFRAPEDAPQLVIVHGWARQVAARLDSLR